MSGEADAATVILNSDGEAELWFRGVLRVTGETVDAVIAYAQSSGLALSIGLPRLFEFAEHALIERGWDGANLGEFV